MLGDWFFGRDKFPHFLIDNCGDLPCNPTCNVQNKNSNKNPEPTAWKLVLILLGSAILVGVLALIVWRARRKKRESMQEEEPAPEMYFELS